jgi:hypothetical protein
MKVSIKDLDKISEKLQTVYNRKKKKWHTEKFMNKTVSLECTPYYHLYIKVSSHCYLLC